MSGEKKAMELQLQVRQNACEYQSSVSDLYSWEKEIKSKERAMQNAPAPTVQPNSAPVRSHVTKAEETLKKSSNDVGSASGSAASTPTEKQDLPTDAVAQQHKKANDMKDRGNSYVKQSDYERAIETYTEAIEVYPHDPIYFINRALCYLKKEIYDRCVEDCDVAIGLDNLCVKAYYRRMQANESLGNNMEALKDCTTVLAIDPKNYEAKRSLERINERLRKFATKNGPNFSAPRDDFIDILPFDKPAYKRSQKPMRRLPVVDIVSPRPNQSEPKQLHITDEEIDKIFNSNCGPFEEVKKANAQKNVDKPKPLETKQKLDVQIQETKQPSSQSKEASKTSDKAVETASLQTIKPEESSKNMKIVEVAAARQDSVKLKDTEKSVKAVEKSDLTTTLNTTNTKTVSQPQVDQSEVSSMEHVPAAPNGTAQFYITWKELSPNQKYHYLKSIEIANLCKILGAGFDPDTFADLLRTLHDFYVPNKEPTTAAVLLEISKNDEFTILAMLMSKEEKKLVAFVMDEIKKFPKNNPALLDKLTKAFNLA
ncbi:RNA polymerase II-associated protein 3 [Drosophila grimshawi]|uniref:RNA polymerase II-associated protein 3 n=1 Tax=Drosophila grimshawi TaxID=7222 RepID=UPI000C87143C|nr:RNA polymerase II-associated protein 3 [Drosophila grimshawi]